MRLDEFTLAGEQPSPLQRAVPATARPAQQSAPITGGTVTVDQVKKAISELVFNAEKLPDESQAKQLTIELLQRIASYGSDPSISEAIKSTSTQDNLRTLTAETFLALNNMPPELLKLVFGTAKVSIDAVKAEQLSKQVIKDKGVKKAAKAYETSVKLDVQGNVVEMDKKLEATAHRIAKRLKLNIKWARNLIGMFGSGISREDRDVFLEACDKGKALDIPRMLEGRTGKLEDYINPVPPTIQQVFDSIKGTLLDISLSSGQGAATGPFEAMLAIMGGAQKAATGDLIIDGKKYEVKSGSISIKKDKTAGNSNAWLDATGEIAPSNIRADFIDAIQKVAPKLAKDPLAMTCDFRPGTNKKPTLSQMNALFTKIDKTVKNGSVEILKTMHTNMFPSTSKLKSKGWDFNKSILTIRQAITNGDANVIAKEQGTMAMLEYAVGKYKSGFILYNSSFQEFLILKDEKEIIEMAMNPDAFGVNFQASTVTMGKSRKSSPGVYFGPTASSPRGKEYRQQVINSPDFAEKYFAGEEINQQEYDDHNDI